MKGLPLYIDFKEKASPNHYNNTKIYSMKSSPSLIFDEAKLKDYENLNLNHLISDKEKYRLDLNKVNIELVELESNLESYNKKTKSREFELRAHIKNISEKSRIRDIAVVKTSIVNLHDEIVVNINNIEGRSLTDLADRKRDIQSRVSLRIKDSESRHRNVLSGKVKDHEEIIRSLHEFTREMNKINENYEKIKKKSESLSSENHGFKMARNDIEIRNSILKVDLMNLKKLNNLIALKIANKKSMKNPKSHRKVKSFSNVSNLKTPEPFYLDSPNLSGRNIISGISSGLNNYNDSSSLIRSVSELLNKEDFIKSNPRSSNILSSLANINENCRIKLNKLKRDTEDIVPGNEIIEKIYGLITNSKFKTINRNNSEMSRKRSDNFIVGNGIFMNKEERGKFIDTLVTDPSILYIFRDEKFPNISVGDRKLI